MATIHPFKAWRPKADYLKEIACVPYDVIDSEEASILTQGNPNSFLHVIRPEIDLPKTISLYDEAVYQKGKENLTNLLKGDLFIQEDSPSHYLYELIMNGRSQTGLFTCVSVEDYDNEVILKHELTRPDKEDDRTRHILTQQAHAEPVMLTFESNSHLDTLLSETKNKAPLYQFTADDDVKHTIWRCNNNQALTHAFTSVPNLYVADGHHRCKSASRVAEAIQNKSRDGDEYRYFPAVLFPISEMMIMPYNRVLHTVIPLQINQLFDTLHLTETSSKTPKHPGLVSVYYLSKWYQFNLPETKQSTIASLLDVARLSEYVLEPIFGITDVRRDKNISFVGGIRGTNELERLVDSGKAEIAFSLYATSVEELVAISNNRELMPPKSTWFEPKLRSGILIHTF